MTPDEITELKQLIEFLKENGIGEFDFERGDTKVRIKFDQPAHGSSASALDLARLGQLLGPPQQPPASASHGIHAVAPSAETTGADADEDKALHIVKSPIVGTFYGSPSPGASPFVVAGDHVDKGQVICIVEAMKLMNEIEADASGEIVKRLVNNGQPVEYGQPLFAIRTS